MRLVPRLWSPLGSGCEARGSLICYADDNAPAAGTVPATPPAPPAATPAAKVAAPAASSDEFKALEAKLVEAHSQRKALEAKLVEVSPAVEKFNKIADALGGKEAKPEEEIPALKARHAQAEKDLAHARAENALFRLAYASEAADADDVVLALSGKIEYDATGKIDAAVVKKQIAELLDVKKHWKRGAGSTAAHTAQASGPPLPGSIAAPHTTAPATMAGSFTEHALHTMDIGDLRKIRAAAHTRAAVN